MSNPFIKRTISFMLLSIVFTLCLCAAIKISKRFDNGTDTEENRTETEHFKYENSPTVIIDAGHGGEDGGAVGIDGTNEKELNLKVALMLEEMLRSYGVKTRLTRDSDTMLYDKNGNYEGHKKAQDMAARLAISEEYENAIFISIHMNTFTQEKYSGLQVYYSENSSKSAELAELIQSNVINKLQPNNSRKIKPSSSGIYLLEKITHPAILIECGFISNSEECALLNSEEYRQKLCTVIYYSILEYLDNNITAS